MLWAFSVPRACFKATQKNYITVVSLVLPTSLLGVDYGLDSRGLAFRAPLGPPHCTLSLEILFMRDPRCPLKHEFGSCHVGYLRLVFVTFCILNF
jgi:hypothetical protein